MLLQRSILVQASLLLAACLVNSQRHQSEYEVSDGDDDDHQSSYTGDSDKPDYSSYYKSDVSAPLITSPVQGGDSASGFNPVEFSSFFSSPHFDFGSASNTKEIHKPIPLVQQTKEAASTGFVTPANFQAGFGNYKADPFSRDFFEQSAQKQQQKTLEEDSNDEAETRPGPNYVSHRVPASLAKEQLKTYATEVHDLNAEPDYDNYRRESVEDDEEKENLEDDKEELNEEEDEDAEEEKPAKYTKPVSVDFDIKHLSAYNLPEFDQKKLNEEETEKASYAAANNQFIPNYYTKYTQVAQPTLSPYQKYSFQPVTDPFGLKTGYLEALQSTVAPFNPNLSKVASETNVNNKYETQPTKTVSKNVKGKKCKQINKDITEQDIRTGRFKRQAMNCYVCEDPKNGANYEQCSYSSDPNTQSYFTGKAEKYSKPVTSESFRYKRYTDKQEQEEEEEEEKGEYVNPYDYVKKQSHKYYSKPEEFSESYYNPKDFGPVEEYRFPKEYFDQENDDKEKSESEIQSEKLVKDGENCKKVKKDTMTCMVCTNPKTGGNYEQCSYTSAPAEKKYAYVRERKFDENENPIEDKVVESTAPKEVVDEERKPAITRRNYKQKAQRKEREDSSEDSPRRRESYSSGEAPNKHHEKESLRQSPRRTKPQNRRRYHSEEREPEESKKREVENSSYEFPEHFVESTTKREKAGLRGLDPELFGSADSRERKEKNEKEVEDYHYTLFPKYNEESESKNEEKRVRPSKKHYEYEDGSKKDVEAVLAEFAKKDRSQCKKAHRNGMTCYLCVDKNGVKNEECMFVSESQPQSSHVAYHEVKKVKAPEEDEDRAEEEAESKQKEVTKQLKRENQQKKRKPYKKFTTPSPVDVAAEPSRESSSRIRTTTPAPPSSYKSRVPRKLKRDKNVPKDVAVEESRRKQRKIKPQDAGPTKKARKQDNIDEDGLITLETSPIYSKVHGVTLPKYMVDVSEFERTFDVDSKPNH